MPRSWQSRSCGPFSCPGWRDLRCGRAVDALSAPGASRSRSSPSPSSSFGPPRHSGEEEHVVNSHRNADEHNHRLAVDSPPRSGRLRGAGGRAACDPLMVLIGSDAAWWTAVAFALAPDLAVLYRIAPGLARGQRPASRATPQRTTPLLGTPRAAHRHGHSRAAARLARRRARLGLPHRFRPRDRLRLRSPDGFQRSDQTT
jgi:hypothetical protein